MNVAGGSLNNTGEILNVAGGSLNDAGSGLNKTGNSLNVAGGTLNVAGGSLNVSGVTLNNAGGADMVDSEVGGVDSTDSMSLESNYPDLLKNCWSFRDMVKLNLYVFNDYGDKVEMDQRIRRFKRKIENEKPMTMTEAELLIVCKKAQPCFRLDVGGINRCHIQELYSLINFMKSHVRAVKDAKNFIMKRRRKAKAGALARHEVFDIVYAGRVLDCLRRYIDRCEVTLNRWFSYVKEADTENSTTLALQEVASEVDRARIRDGTLVRMTVQEPDTGNVRSFLLSRKGFAKWMALNYRHYCE